MTIAEYLVSDVIERYSAVAPDIRQTLQDAKAAVGRATDAMKLRASSEKTSTRKKAVAKKSAVKVPRAKPKKAKKQRASKRDYEE